MCQVSASVTPKFFGGAPYPITSAILWDSNSDFSLLPGDLGVMGPHPPEAQNHQELGHDGNKEISVLLGERGI